MVNQSKYEVALAEKVKKIWIEAVETADNFISKGDLARLDTCSVIAPAASVLSAFHMELFHMKRLAFNPDEGIVDKLVNVYASMNSIGATIFIIINGRRDGFIELYIGCMSRDRGEASKMMLKSSFEGNFPGIEIERLTAEQKNEILDDLFPLEYDRKSVASVSVSADFRKFKTEDVAKYIQGVEKFIDSMKGQEYTSLFLAEPISHDDCNEKRLACENIITELSKFNKVTLTYNENNSVAVNSTISEGTSHSISHSISTSISKGTSVSIGKNKGKSRGSSFGFFGTSQNFGSMSGTSNTTTTNDSDTSGTSDSDSDTTNRNVTKGDTHTEGNSTGMTLNVENKRISNIIAKLEYELKKIERSDSFGLWDVAIYILSSDANTPIIAANSIRSLVIGDESGKAESFINYWDGSARTFTQGVTEKIITYLHYGMHPVFGKQYNGQDYYFTPAISVGGDVLPSIVGLPMKSVPGITVIESAEFGRNIVTDDHSDPGNRKIRMGEIMYMGKKDSTVVELFVNSLSSHAFICGAPGSGKSNTVYKLLYELNSINTRHERDDGYGNAKFLVIEPAKGEYKYEFGKMPGINIFTTDPGICNLLCINPFEFPYETMNIQSHIERLKNIITACWPLTAAMPAILGEALEQAFVKVGWDIMNSIFIYPGSVKFPSFNDVLDILPKIIDNSDYSSQNKGDYKGALVTRVSTLTRGIIGTVFSDVGTIPDKVLFDENTIIDLSTVGSTEARALIMGIIVMKLENYRKSTAMQSNYPLRHITILEEAHNLLPRCSTAQSDDSSNVQGKSVETISNAISEMRTYGEGFIIVDQSPSAVATVAVSNTSTKIIMRLPGEEDVQAAGASVGLDDNQKKQIPMLPQGQAIVKQGNWIAPIMMLVDRAPIQYRTRRLTTYYYEDLKMFRGDLLKKIYAIIERNKNNEKIPYTDCDIVLRFINKQREVEPDKLRRIEKEWCEFCDCNKKHRHIRETFLVINVLSFESAIAMIPGYRLKEDDTALLREWCEFLETMVLKYVDTEDDVFYKIMCSVIRYCMGYSKNKYVVECASYLWNRIRKS